MMIQDLERILSLFSPTVEIHTDTGDELMVLCTDRVKYEDIDTKWVAISCLPKNEIVAIKIVHREET